MKEPLFKVAGDICFSFERMEKHLIAIDEATIDNTESQRLKAHERWRQMNLDFGFDVSDVQLKDEDSDPFQFFVLKNIKFDLMNGEKLDEISYQRLLDNFKHSNCYSW